MKALVTLLVTLTVATGAMASEATPAPEIDNFQSTKTRAEVRAETVAAIAAGRIVRNEADFERLAKTHFVPTKTRAQVIAETREAIRLGLVTNGEFDSPQATPAQLEQIRLAGLSAVATAVASR